MSCCYSGPHTCDLCLKSFRCEGTRGNPVYNYTRGYITCVNCTPYVPRPTGCFESFESRNKLFKHLKIHKDHVMDYPKVCGKCNKKFKNKNDIIDHMDLCCYIPPPLPPNLTGKMDLVTCIRLGLSYKC